MPTNKTLYALGLTSLGLFATSSTAYAAPDAVNSVREVNVVTEGAATRITIIGSQPFTPVVRSQSKPGVTVISLPGIWEGGRTGMQRVGKNGVAFVRYGQYTVRPAQQMQIVANHSTRNRTTLKYDLQPSADQTRWDVVVYAPGAEPEEVAAPTPETTTEPTAAVSVATALPRTLSVERLATAGEPIQVVRALPGTTVGQVVARSGFQVAGGFPVAEGRPAATATTLPEPKLSASASVATVSLPRPIAALVPLISESARFYASRTARPAVSSVSEKPIRITATPPRRTKKSVAAKAKSTAPTTLQEALAAPVKTPVSLVRPDAIIGTPAPSIVVEPPVATSPAVTVAVAPALPAVDANPKKIVGVIDDPLSRIVTLNAVRTELSDVLKLLSQQSKVNVVSGQSVGGKNVTLALQGVTLRDTLDWVTRTSGLRYTIEGNTVIVGTGQEISALKRTAQTTDASNAAIPFVNTDGDSLKNAIERAFPNVTLSIVSASAEAKSGGSSSQTTNTAPGSAAPKPGEAAPSNNNAFKPRGGVIYVVGTRDEVEEIRKTVEDLERGMIDIARREIEANNERTKNYVTETYEVKYVSASDSAKLLQQRIPTLKIEAGPAPRFIARSTGGSATFTGGGVAGAGGAVAGATGTGMGTSSNASSGARNDMTAPLDGPSTTRSQDESRVLLLTGTPNDVSRAKEILAKLDTRPTQILFKAEIRDINRSDALNLGLRYDLSQKVNIGEKSPGDSKGTIAPTGAVTESRPFNFGAIYRTPYGISAQLDALEKKGRAKTLAEPTLRALDGLPAVCFIGDEIKYVVGAQTAQTGTTLQVETAQVGITLNVTGKSNGDGTITLYIHPQVSSISSYVTAGGISLPQIATRFVDTTVRVKEGETLVLGGLLRKEEFDNVQGVPLLSKLPVLGQLFRSSNKQFTDSEVMVFITAITDKD